MQESKQEVTQVVFLAKKKKKKKKKIAVNVPSVSSINKSKMGHTNE